MRRGAPTTRACGSAAVLPMNCRWLETSSSACATTAERDYSTARFGRCVHTTRMGRKPDRDSAERTTKVWVRPDCFPGTIEQLDWPARKRYDEFDFGYVLTVHKAQGSQWDDVVLFDESSAFPDNRDRW